ncbi:MAG: flavin reductase [Clostridia bacterium]|nr:flavin reductase [Clostridia bacterium]
MDHKSLYKLTYGLFLLTAQHNGRDNGCIINTAVQVANDPARISIAVIKGGCTHDMVLATGMFNVSALTVDAPFSLFRHFGMQSGRTADKFADFPDVSRSENGLYYLTAGANGYLSCKVVGTMDLGSHTLFIGKLTDGVVLSDRPSCTYAYYQSDIKQKPAPLQKKGWVCSVCGYVYEGDEVPEDFLCPLCKHGKEDFVPLNAPAAPETAAPAEAASAAKWVCSVCGYVHEGNEPPAQCPVCKVGPEKFTRQSGETVWAAEHVIGVAKGAPQEIIDGLRANFEGECSEVGMYLAMARVAHREGLPEIGKYWEKAGWEEAEHAAKFAELLGEVVTDSTKKNLELRVEAEFGATAGKVELADLARTHGLDAIADTVMEMARDEARHGKALKGLLERNFGQGSC